MNTSEEAQGKSDCSMADLTPGAITEYRKYVCAEVFQRAVPTLHFHGVFDGTVPLCMSAPAVAALGLGTQRITNASLGSLVPYNRSCPFRQQACIQRSCSRFSRGEAR